MDPFSVESAYLLTLLPDKIQHTTYKSLILYTLSAIPQYTKQKRQQLLSFLLQQSVTESYRITKYDEKHRDYYRILVAIYGLSCPYFNADYSIDVSIPIIINVLEQALKGCACNKTDTIHLQLMHA